MSKQIVYDFTLAQRSADKLDSISEEISKLIGDRLDNELGDIKSYWNGEASERFLGGIESVSKEIEKIEKDLIIQSEKIRRVSRHMRLIEEEAELISKE